MAQKHRLPNQDGVLADVRQRLNASSERHGHDAPAQHEASASTPSGSVSAQLLASQPAIAHSNEKHHADPSGAGGDVPSAEAISSPDALPSPESPLSIDEAHEDVFEGYALQRLGFNIHYWFFPGLVMHELSHYLVAVLSGARVAEVVFWSPRGGHVMHTRVRGSSSVLIATAPLIINNLLALVLLQDGLNALFTASAGATEWLWGAVAVWVGFSFAIYSFPSKPDLRISRLGLNRSYWGKLEGGLLTRLAALLLYPLLFIAHAIFVLFVVPFSTNRTLRLLWGVAMVAFFLSGVPGQQLF